MTWRETYDLIHPYLCPAGEGVFAVSTGKDYKDALQQQLYGTNKHDEVVNRWRSSLQSPPSPEKPLLLGIASDVGGGIQRGANWGPLFIRQALYKSFSPQQLTDLGDVRVIPQLLLDDHLNQETIAKCRQALYGDKASDRVVSPLSITEKVCQCLYQQLPDMRLLALGGDHSVSYPLVKSYLQAKRQQGIKVGVLHFDAHTDLLTQRLGIDVCFGSWSYHILPYLDQPQDLIQVGIRASAKERTHWENTFGVKQYWADEIKQQGIINISEQIRTLIKQRQLSELYVTVDIDSLDQRYASATGTPEPNGLSPQDIISLLDELSTDITISAADIMEVAPFVSHQQEQPEPDTTLQSAVMIAVKLIGLLGHKT